MGDKKCCQCTSPLVEEDDGLCDILVFGVTGMLGKAVAESAITSPFFRVHGFTRYQESEVAQSLVRKGVDILEGDLTQFDTVLKATCNMDVVVLNTCYWEKRSAEDEYMQGYNVITAAAHNGVKHLIYLGTDYLPICSDDDICSFLDGKAKISHYLVYVGIPYTIIRIGWFYENFLLVFQPHPITETVFTIPIPMGDRGLNMGCLRDYANCIVTIALRPRRYINRTIKLSACYMTVKEIASAFQACYTDFQFMDPQITVEDYLTFNFMGSKELATMFSHYQTRGEWDNDHMKDLSFMVTKFDDWLARHKEEMETLLAEKIKENVLTFAFQSDSWKGLESTQKTMKSLITLAHESFDFPSIFRSKQKEDENLENSFLHRMAQMYPEFSTLLHFNLLNIKETPV